MPQPECLRYLFKGGRAPYRFFLYTETTQRHHEPHVHVEGREWGKISVSLISLAVLAPPSVSAKCPLVEILKIISEHQLLLLAELESLERKAGHHDDAL